MLVAGCSCKAEWTTTPELGQQHKGKRSGRALRYLLQSTGSRETSEILVWAGGLLSLDLGFELNSFQQWRGWKICPGESFTMGTSNIRCLLWAHNVDHASQAKLCENAIYRYPG